MSNVYIKWEFPTPKLLLKNIQKQSKALPVKHRKYWVNEPNAAITFILYPKIIPKDHQTYNFKKNEMLEMFV